MNEELLALVKVLSKERSVDPEVVFRGIESGLVAAARRRFGLPDSAPVKVTVDRASGDVRISDESGDRGPLELTRTVALAARQTILQRIREAEVAADASALVAKKGTVVSGTVRRFQGDSIVVEFGGAEGLIQRREQVPTESFRIGETIQALLLDIRGPEGRGRPILSRTHEDFLRRLLEREIPELREGVVKIHTIVRDPGIRAKISVSTAAPKVDPVGTCIGVRGARIMAVRDALRGEQIDVVTHDENPPVFVANALKPASPTKLVYFAARRRVKVHVRLEKLPIAIGKGGQNVRLTSRLVGVEIDVNTAEEFERGAGRVRWILSKVPGLPETAQAAILAAGFTSPFELMETPAAELATLGGIEPKLASEILAVCHAEIRPRGESAGPRPGGGPGGSRPGGPRGSRRAFRPREGRGGPPPAVPPQASVQAEAPPSGAPGPAETTSAPESPIAPESPPTPATEPPPALPAESAPVAATNPVPSEPPEPDPAPPTPLPAS